jgi:hypothetical protein
MRTLWFVLAGFVLLALCLAGARLLASNLAEPMRTAVIAFCVIWFVVAAANLGLGVAKAGYTLAEELPIFLLIFGLPAAVAIFVKWKWL